MASITYLQGLAAERGGECLSIEYRTLGHKYFWRCAKSHEWEVKASNIQAGSWCPICARVKYTIEDAHALARQNGGCCLSTQYSGENKLRWRCTKDHEWDAKFYTIKQGVWCNECRSKEAWNGRNRASFKQLQDYAHSKGGTYISPEYLGVHGIYQWACAEGHEWKSGISSAKKNWCSRCKIEKEHNQALALAREIAMKKSGQCLSDKYEASQSALRWKCSKGHEWKDRLSAIKKGKWCPRCSAPKEKIKHYAYTTEDMRRLAAKYKGEFISKTFAGVAKKHSWSCGKGHEWESQPRDVLNGLWCPNCKRENANELKLEEVFKVAQQKGGRCLSIAYLNSQTPMQWQCSEGHEWTAVYAQVKNANTWCPECAKKKIGAANRKWSLSKIKAIARERGGECIENSFTSLTKKMNWKCANGHEWQASGHNVVHNKSWCPHCIRVDFTIERLHEAAKARGGKCLAKACNEARNKVKWQCSNGHLFLATPHHVIQNGSWCRICAASRGESFCRLAFETMFGAKFPNTRPEWLRGSTGNKLELDGYNSDLKLAFEHHGIQHYVANNLRGQRGSPEAKEALRMRKIIDSEKRAICEEYGVTLIEIPEVPFKTKVEDLKAAIIEKCGNAGFRLPQNIQEIEIDFAQAYISSAINKTFEKYQATAKERGGEMVSTVYKGSNEKHAWRCANGHQWEATPANVTRKGSWCPRCAGLTPLSIGNAREVAADRGGECLSMAYVNNKAKLKWRCSEGHEWEACLANVKNQKQWCPECASKQLWEKRRANTKRSNNTDSKQE